MDVFPDTSAAKSAQSNLTIGEQGSRAGWPRPIRRAVKLANELRWKIFPPDFGRTYRVRLCGFDLLVLRESEMDVMAAQPMHVFIIATKAGQCCQTGRSIGTPTHAVMLLPVGNEQIIGFLNRITRHTKTQLLSERVTRNKAQVARKVANQFLNVLCILDVIWMKRS